MLSRRGVLALIGSGWCSFASGNKDFWNQKDPAAWTADEVEELLSKSPWAKQATVEYAAGATDHRVWGETPPGFPGGGRLPQKGGGRSRPVRSSAYRVTWASAAPILAATKTPLPDAFRDHFTLSVSGLLPGSSLTSPDRLDDLKQFTTLKPKTRALAQAGVVEWQAASKTLLFGFSRDILEFSKTDPVADFETKIGRLGLKVRFEPKEMIYRGQLAL